MKKPILAVLLLTLILPGRVEALDTRELVALVAMPLAVAAVSELADVPADDLFSLIAVMNQASVPPTQFVEVVRYVPVALIDPSEPRLVSYVTTEFDRGVIGSALAISIGDRIRLLGVDEINVVSPPVFTHFDRSLYVPPVVVTRLRSGHPHGGPPGQLKKQLGVQTGAEIVHGDARSGRSPVTRVVNDDRSRPVKVKKDRGVSHEVRGDDRHAKIEPHGVGRTSKPRHAAKPKHEDGHGKPGASAGHPGKGKGKGKGQ